MSEFIDDDDFNRLKEFSERLTTSENEDIRKIGNNTYALPIYENDGDKTSKLKKTNKIIEIVDNKKSMGVRSSDLIKILLDFFKR